MQKPLLLLAFGLMLIPTGLLKSQDVELYPHFQDDLVHMPDLYENMLFSDYQFLTRNIRMIDAVNSTIMPGYIHLISKEYVLAAALAGVRVASYAGIIYSSKQLKKVDLTLSDVFNDDYEVGRERKIFVASLAAIAMTVAFDWVHGRFKLQKKQELLRYKYGMKMKMEQLYGLNTSSLSLTPMMSLTYNF